MVVEDKGTEVDDTEALSLIRCRILADSAWIRSLFVEFEFVERETASSVGDCLTCTELVCAVVVTDDGITCIGCC